NIVRIGLLLPFASRPAEAGALYQAAELAVFTYGEPGTLLIPRDSGATAASAADAARLLLRDGADVIDIGCLPDTPFPHMEDCIRALKAEGFQVSIDSLNTDDLLRGAYAAALGRAGATTLTASNSAEAMRQLERADAAVVDWRLAGQGDGFEAIGQMRARRPRLAVV
ncbi:MAG: hypothetical protein JNL98_45105, partial [Bryobacterales bacterium]|nr:hypothetical protein [Bryobacterales bacterium]